MICPAKVTVQRRNFYGELHFDLRVNSREKWEMERASVVRKTRFKCAFPPLPASP